MHDLVFSPFFLMLDVRSFNLYTLSVAVLCCASLGSCWASGGLEMTVVLIGLDLCYGYHTILHFAYQCCDFLLWVCVCFADKLIIHKRRR